MPHQDETGHCDHCLQPVLWTVTVPNNARKPVNPEPDENGNTCVYRDETGRLRSRQLTTERPVPEHAEQLYMPHAATCNTPRPRRRQSRPRPAPRRTLPYRPGRTW